MDIDIDIDINKDKDKDKDKITAIDVIQIQTETYTPTRDTAYSRERSQPADDAALHSRCSTSFRGACTVLPSSC